MVNDFGFAADWPATVSGGTIMYAATELLEAKLAKKEFPYLPCHDLISAVKLLWLVNREDERRELEQHPTDKKWALDFWKQREGYNVELQHLVSLARKASYAELFAYYKQGSTSL